ncbi:MAG: DUF484 family protein [Alphaproteobacteria bacterium]|nr:DUF484 family protein [Alphaproteobacteria bacterium]
MKNNIESEQIAEYLKKHPDFLLRNENLLDVLFSPSRWNGDKIVDFQHAVIERHKKRLKELEASSDNVLDIARMNMSGAQKVHGAVLAIIEADSFEYMSEVITSVFPVLLDIDVAIICFEQVFQPTSQDSSFTDLLSANVQILNSGVIDRVLGENNDLLSCKSIKKEKEIFGVFSDMIKSEAFIRLKTGNSSVAGMLVLGSRDEEAFSSDFTGTSGLSKELLRFMVRAIELSCLRITNA